MLPLLKKKTKAGSATTQMPAWHPSFRNYERLPDIKVVRTVFFVNGVAITVVLALFIVFIVKEYRLFSLRHQVAQAQAEIDRDKRGSDQAIALYKKFQNEEKRMQEIETFLKSRPLLSDLLLQFGETLPKNIAFTSLEMHDNGLVIRGSVRGAPELASGEASNYVEQLRADQTIKGQFDEVTLTSITRSPQTGRLSIELFLKFKGAKK
jgi:hypothetical protein